MEVADCPRFPFVQQGYVVQEDLLNTIGVVVVFTMGVKTQHGLCQLLIFRGIPLF